MGKLKKAVILGVLFLGILIMSVMFSPPGITKLGVKKYVQIENEEKLFDINLYSISSGDQTYVITLFDSGRLETVQGLRDNDEIRNQEGISKVRSRKSVQIETTEMEILLQLVEEITSDAIIGPENRDLFSGATYFRVVSQDRKFEIWTAYLTEEGREFFGVEDEYEADICEKAFELWKMVKELSALKIPII